MTIPIRQSTASQEIPLGYLLDSTDGDTEETGLTIANTDIKLWKRGATTLANKNSGGATHISNGIYYCVLDATDSNTLGGLVIFVHVAGALATRIECEVMTANRFDALVLGTDVLHADMTQIGGVAQSATDLKDMVDTGYDPATHKIQSDLIYIHGTALTETDGQLAAAFKKLFDVATPLLVASDVMRGTEAAALATTALSTATWTAARAGALTDWINGGRLDLILDIIANDTTVDIPALIATAQADLDIITGEDGAVLAAAATSAQLVDDMWDEILSGATHNIAASAGRRVRETGAYAIESGTAQAGNSHTITLAATASAVDGTYNRNLIVITDNTGVGQARTIVDYNGTTKVAIIDRDWRTSPDATTEYQVTPDNTPLVVDQGVAQAGTATTITLRAYASAVNDIYLCNVVAIIAGTGRGQARLIGAYNGTTKVATICGDNWITTPDATSVYVLMPYGTTCTSCIGTYALGLIKSENNDALTDYGPNTVVPATPAEVATAVENGLTVDTIADSYATDGAQPTIAQSILAIQQMLQEKSISGTTLTVKKPDGSTVAMTFTLDSATAPTSITRAT